jgi:hypothetical protein
LSRNIGAAALDLMTKDAAFAAEFTALLNHYVKKPRDRALFDFLTDRQPD